LELKFGEYTESFSSPEEFDEGYDDLVENLGEYLLSIEEKFDFNKVSKESLFSYLKFPGICLPQGDKDATIEFSKIWAGHEWYVDIMTFNYTRTIEKIVTNGALTYSTSSQRLDKNCQLRDILHIHGFTDERMILGVNDISQIKNDNFHNVQEVTNALIKSNNNRGQRHLVDKVCVAKVKKANLICIYGSSLGETDAMWWKEIGKRLLSSNQCQVIIYYHTPKTLSARLSWKKERIETATKNIFLERTELSDTEKDIVKDRIYVTVNSKMFADLEVK
jgi:hypothetical protein